MTSVQILFVSFLAACSSSSPSPAPAPVDLDRRVTPAECSAAVDHAAALLAADPETASYAEELRRTRATAVEQCLATATLRDHQCLMAAVDSRELGLCPMPGTGGER
jgi:hypothetical protein